MLNIARQKLRNFNQRESEKVNAFVERLRNTARAATLGLNDITFKDMLFGHLMDRLRPDISFFLQIASPTSFEDALTKACQIENLLLSRKIPKINISNQPQAINNLHD